MHLVLLCFVFMVSVYDVYFVYGCARVRLSVRLLFELFPPFCFVHSRKMHYLTLNAINAIFCAVIQDSVILIFLYGFESKNSHVPIGICNHF